MRLRVDNTDASQVEDRRGMGGGRGAAAGGVGIVGVIVAVLFQLLNGGGEGGGFDINAALPPQAQAQGEPLPKTAAQEAEAKNITLIVNHVQKTWTDLFAAGGQQYRKATLVLFEDAVSTGGCGQASSAVGPFYCPADEKIYLDLGFFKDLQTKFGAPGDFAQAYVIAHEFGHHIQTVLNVESQVRKQQQANPDQANEYSIRMELQADCFAGVWGHAAYKGEQLDPGDLAEGLAAAQAVGDDRLQEQAGGRVNPESWTHGSSEQRDRWFQKGFDSGDPAVCDTFKGDA